MLVLSRNVGESIVIDHKTKVTVIKVRGNKVALGIEAPQEIRVHRSEVEQRVMEAARNAEAGQGGP